MVTKLKYAAQDALNVVHNQLTDELRIYRFDKPTRTKAHLFGVGGRHGRQFGIVLGNTDTETMIHPAQQTKIVLEKCEIPNIAGIEYTEDQVKGSRFKQEDSKIHPGDQTAFFVADETALKALLRWYSK